MSTRYITLGCGRKIGLAAYVKAWHQCLALPPETWIGRGVNGWGQTAGEALSDLRRGLADRINRNDPDYGKGRKWSYDWQKDMIQTAWRVNTPRLILDWLPPDLKARFGYRLRENRI